jgi:hypothetical protein
VKKYDAKRNKRNVAEYVYSHYDKNVSIKMEARK